MLVIIVVVNGKTCLCCGACCKVLAFNDVPGINQPEIREQLLKPGIKGFDIPKLANCRILIEYYKAKGLRRKGSQLTVPAFGKIWIEGRRLLIEHRCPKLTEDNKCSIWGKHPLACKRFKGQGGDGKYYICKECVYHPDNQ